MNVFFLSWYSVETNHQGIQLIFLILNLNKFNFFLKWDYLRLNSMWFGTPVLIVLYKKGSWTLSIWLEQYKTNIFTQKSDFKHKPQIQLSLPIIIINNKGFSTQLLPPFVGSFPDRYAHNKIRPQQRKAKGSHLNKKIWKISLIKIKIEPSTLKLRKIKARHLIRKFE